MVRHTLKILQQILKIHLLQILGYMMVVAFLEEFDKNSAQEKKHWKKVKNPVNSSELAPLNHRFAFYPILCRNFSFLFYPKPSANWFYNFFLIFSSSSHVYTINSPCNFLTLPVPCFSECCNEIKIMLNFYFRTSLWCLSNSFMKALNISRQQKEVWK